MTAAILPRPSSLCPSWFGEIPTVKEKSQDTPGDWAYVQLKKNKLLTHTYMLQKSTGDLYLGELLYEHEEKKTYHKVTRRDIALKAFAMGIGSIPYGIALMGSNLCKIPYKISSVVWELLPQLCQEALKLGVIPSITNFAIRTFCLLPMDILEKFWLIVRSPFYSIALIGACVAGVLSPLEGRVWIAHVEKEWHRGDSYKMSLQEMGPITLSERISAIHKGKYPFLGWCMQKRGNIQDSDQGKRVYQWVEEE